MSGTNGWEHREVDLVDYREGGNIALADLFEDVVHRSLVYNRALYYYEEAE